MQMEGTETQQQRNIETEDSSTDILFNSRLYNRHQDSMRVQKVMRSISPSKPSPIRDSRSMPKLAKRNPTNEQGVLKDAGPLY